MVLLAISPKKEDLNNVVVYTKSFSISLNPLFVTSLIPKVEKLFFQTEFFYKRVI
jgi:hypothetical protein